MVNGKYGKVIAEYIRKDLEYFKKNKKEFDKNPDYGEALRVLISLIITKSWWRDRFLKTKNFDAQFKEFLYQNPDFRTRHAQKKLIQLAERITPFKETIPKIKLLFSQLKNKSIKEWSNDLNRSLDTSVLGPKGRDNYLRDFGWWGRVPMDRHEMRFIIRTGIYHIASNKGYIDPLNKDELQEVFVSFCNHHLRGKMIEGVDLGESPGVVDIFIWRFCKDKNKEEPGMQICGSEPKCGICPLKTSCLLSLWGMTLRGIK